jgi:hypothetical protein
MNADKNRSNQEIRIAELVERRCEELAFISVLRFILIRIICVYLWLAILLASRPALNPER